MKYKITLRMNVLSTLAVRIGSDITMDFSKLGRGHDEHSNIHETTTRRKDFASILATHKEVVSLMMTSLMSAGNLVAENAFLRCVT